MHGFADEVDLNEVDKQNWRCGILWKEVLGTEVVLGQVPLYDTRLREYLNPSGQLPPAACLPSWQNWRKDSALTEEPCFVEKSFYLSVGDSRYTAAICQER